MSQALDRILATIEDARHRGDRPVVLFDLDDTLLSTTRRHRRIMLEFSERLAGSRPEDAERLRSAGPEHMRYSIVDTAKAAGLSDPATLSDLRAFWFERFFKNEYIADDPAIEGAAEFCQEALALGARIVYLTGRDESMRPGTLDSLSENGFPLPEGQVVHLMLKPSFEMNDAVFKAEALRGVAELGTVVAGFENEPAHVNLFKDAFPKAEIVLLETRHAGKPIQPYPGIRKLPHFRKKAAA